VGSQLSVQMPGGTVLVVSLVASTSRQPPCWLLGHLQGMAAAGTSYETLVSWVCRVAGAAACSHASREKREHAAHGS
jgi:hypothetical protein